MAVAVVRNAGQRHAQLRGLQHLGRPAPQRRGECMHLLPRDLLMDAEHLGAMPLQGVGSGQQQRAGARHQHALAAHRCALLGQRLRATGTGNAGQGPAREWQQQFACTGCQHQCAVAERGRAVVAVEQQLLATGRDHFVTRQQRHTRRVDLVTQCQRRCGGTEAHIVAPDLAAGHRLHIHDHHACALRRSSDRSRQAGWAGADHGDIAIQDFLSHGSAPPWHRPPAAGRCVPARRR
ncbi:hypothetical protein D3C71_925930 [compost metagenome]